MKTLLFSLFFFPTIVFAQAQVFPTRLTLTEEAPSSYLNLRNASGKPQKFKIELIQFQMGKDGSMKRSKEPNPILVDLLKYSPKNIEVAPGEKQVVRVMNTSFDTLKDGDYYVHLHFLPEDEPAEKPDAPKTKGSLSLQAKIAVAVPVVVRKGTAKLDGKLTGTKASIDKDGNIAVSFKLTNSTSYFLTGDLEILGVTDKGETSITKVIGLSSYIPERMSETLLPAKDIKAVIKDEDTIKKIKVHYVANADAGAAFDLSGEAELTKAVAKKETKKPSKRR